MPDAAMTSGAERHKMVVAVVGLGKMGARSRAGGSTGANDVVV
jgi:hypothetical protein